MEHALTIETRNQADVLERVLRVTRHRGFLVQSMNIELNAKIYSIELTVSSERPVAQLYNQLIKLFDVEQVTIQQLQVMPAAKVVMA
ncbi:MULTISPECIES: acetolactate synthase 2 small subunit [unclassified Agarivorans]|uniref:acetolactate synthase 2 small subunit n=1 Tax=unclassified Agarivorans TaxID=2636026 RepID=UPI003D7DD1AE